MAGGNDLNLLKSWNPKLSKNRAKVKQKERELLLEEEKIQKQIKERQVNDLASIKSKTGLEWMYEDVETNFNKQTPEKKIQADKLETIPKHKHKPPALTKPSPRIQKYAKDDPMSKINATRKRRNLK